MFLLRKILGLAILFLFVWEGNANNVNIVMLTTPHKVLHETEMDKSIKISIAYVNTRINRQAGFLLKVQKVLVPPCGVFCNEFLYGNQRYILGNASFFLLPYHINGVCALGAMLKVPVVTLRYQPGIFCEKAFSMRPDPVLLNQAVITMIREDRPRDVAVVVEAGFSNFAMSIMSLDQQLNHFVFQIIAVVNFSNSTSISRAVKGLKESGIRKIFLVMQQESLYSFMKEVQAQQFKMLHAFRWFTPVLDTESAFLLNSLTGMTSLSIPIDEEQFNKTVHEFRTRIYPSDPPTARDVNPLIHDALIAIKYATIEYRNQKCDNLPTPRPASYCPIKRSHRGCKSSEEYLSEVIFRGLTGDVKFTKSRYRQVTILDANEVSGTRKHKLGIWSVPCEAFKWDPYTTFAKQKGRALECKKADEGKMSALKPRKRNLRVVARMEKPFIFYDPSLKTNNVNDKFSGFCKDIIDKLATDLDFKYDIYLVSDGKYGNELSNRSSWSGMVGELIKKEADIAIGSLTLSSSRERVIDFSKSFMDFKMALLLKKEDTGHTGYFDFFKPFSFGIWLSILAAVFMVGVTMFIIERFSPFGYRKLSLSSAEVQGDEFNFANSLWFAIASCLQQGPDQTPKSTAGRLLSATFWLFATVITASYVAGLVAFFLASNAHHSISSLEDLTNQDSFEYGVLRNGLTRQLIESSKDPLHRKMYKQMLNSNSFQTSVEAAVKRVRSGDFAFLGDQPVLEYLDQQQPCDTNIAKNLLTMKSYAFGLQLASEWTNPISVGILRLRETGFIDNLRMKWWKDQSECMGTRSGIRQTVPLGFQSIVGIIAILAVGICLSLILLILELKLKPFVKCLRSKQSSLPKTEQRVIKAPQITYLDYKANGQSYDLEFSKLYGSKCNEMSSLAGSYEEVQQKMYKEAPESTL